MCQEKSTYYLLTYIPVPLLQLYPFFLEQRMCGRPYEKNPQAGKGSEGDEFEWLLILSSLLTWDEEKGVGHRNCLQP